MCQKIIDQPIVKSDSFRIDFSGPVREDPRPGKGKTVSVAAQSGNEFDIFMKAMIMIAGNRAVRAVLDPSGLPAENIPDRFASSAFADRTLDLITRSRGPPDEIVFFHDLFLSFTAFLPFPWWRSASACLRRRAVPACRPGMRFAKSRPKSPADNRIPAWQGAL